MRTEIEGARNSNEQLGWFKGRVAARDKFVAWCNSKLQEAGYDLLGDGFVEVDLEDDEEEAAAAALKELGSGVKVLEHSKGKDALIEKLVMANTQLTSASKTAYQQGNKDGQAGVTEVLARALRLVLLGAWCRVASVVLHLLRTALLGLRRVQARPTQPTLVCTTAWCHWLLSVHRAGAGVPNRLQEALLAQRACLLLDQAVPEDCAHGPHGACTKAQLAACTHCLASLGRRDGLSV